MQLLKVLIISNEEWIITRTYKASDIGPPYLSVVGFEGRNVFCPPTKETDDQFGKVL